MTASHLLIVAHGSRRQPSKDDVRQLAERVRALRHPTTDVVEGPSIPEGLARCVAKGARAGTHVVSDIPEAIQAFRAEHPEITVRLTSHLGASDVLPKAILEMARAA
jgi:sirohydrochlorin ferrochelatase